MDPAQKQTTTPASPIPQTQAPPTINPAPAQNPPPQMPPKKGKGLKIISILIILFLLSVSAVAGYRIYKNLTAGKNPETACTQEAKICPDGSSVGRTGPKCEFAPCPTVSPDPTTTLAPIDTSNWKKFSNEFVSFSYPNDWSYERNNDGVTFFGPISNINHIGEKVEPFVSHSVSLQSYDVKADSELKDYLDLLYLNSPAEQNSIETEKIELKNYNAYLVKHKKCVSAVCKTVIIKNGTKIYVFNSEGDGNEVLNGFLPTFTFTN